MNFATIKNIIFDLGDVIINLDYQLTYQAFEKLSNGKITREKIIEILVENKLFDIHGNGDLTDSEFHDQLRSLLLDNNIDSESLNNAFNAMLLDIPESRINLLKTLSKKYRLFLLSNTNFIHIKRVNEILFESCGIRNLEDLFERVYYSHELGLSKPDIKIYQKVLQENNLIPEETIFIDDNISNVEGARLAGIHGIVAKGPVTILEIFENAAQ